MNLTKNIFISLLLVIISGCSLNSGYPVRFKKQKTEAQLVDEQRLIALKAERTISLRQYPAFDPHLVEHKNAIWKSPEMTGGTVDFPDRKLSFSSEDLYWVCLKDRQKTCLTFSKNSEENVRLQSVSFRMEGHPHIDLEYSYPSGVLNEFFVYPNPLKTECGDTYSFKPNGELIPRCCS